MEHFSGTVGVGRHLFMPMPFACAHAPIAPMPLCHTFPTPSKTWTPGEGKGMPSAGVGWGGGRRWRHYLRRSVEKAKWPMCVSM